MKKSSYHQFYQFMIENSLDGILLTSPSGAIHHANPAACRMLERSEEEIIQAGRHGLLKQDDPNLIQALQERKATGKVIAELQFLKPDGTLFPALVSSAVFKTATNEEWTVTVFRDISKLKEVEATLEKEKQESTYLATHDFITNIFNRRGFIENLEKIMNNKMPFSIILCDLDHFKHLNDVLGHLEGDKVLKIVAKKLAIFLKNEQFIGRFGGDEFIVCLPETSLEETYALAKQLLNALTTIILDSPNLQVTASFGIYYHDYTKNLNLDTILSTVDEAMYQAKKTRNTIKML